MHKKSVEKQLHIKAKGSLYVWFFFDSLFTANRTATYSSYKYMSLRTHSKEKKDEDEDEDI
jgi:hypothetical protein